MAIIDVWRQSLSEVTHSEEKWVKERKRNRWKLYKKNVMRERRKEYRNEGNMKNWRQRERECVCVKGKLIIVL
jgi:hypothetical protein